MMYVNTLCDSYCQDFSSDRVAETNPGFSMQEKEHNILDEIDSSLQSIVPKSQWESKSISLANSVGTLTPRTTVFDEAVKNLGKKSADSVMNDLDITKDASSLLKDELICLKNLDEKLSKFQALRQLDNSTGNQPNSAKEGNSLQAKEGNQSEVGVAVLSREQLDHLLQVAEEEAQEIF